MYETTPQEIARILRRDLGIESGIRYAEQIARANGEDSQRYHDAANILRTMEDLWKVQQKTQN